MMGRVKRLKKNLRSKNVSSGFLKKPSKKQVFRILDANLNRAREGIRVLEDTARFLWDDAGLFKSLRAMRHLLDKTTRGFYKNLLFSRESRQDFGRVISENKKRDWKGLLASNVRRAEEALRVLEEYGKVFSPGTTTYFKQIRFQLYTIEKKIFLGR